MTWAAVGRGEIIHKYPHCRLVETENYKTMPGVMDPKATVKSRLPAVAWKVESGETANVANIGTTNNYGDQGDIDMYGFAFGYRWRYYLTNPLEFFDEIRLMLKYAFQRVYRGWDDSVAWGISHHLIRFMPDWIKQMKQYGNGFPAHLHHHDDCDEECRRSVFMASHELVDDGSLLTKWHEILDEIADGFRAADQIQAGSFQIDDELWDEFHSRYPNEKIFWFEKAETSNLTRMVDNPKWAELEKELNVKEIHDQQAQEANEKFKRGMDLFVKHFFDLWD